MNSNSSLSYEESVLMEIKIFRRCMSILNVYKTSINSTVNELFVLYDRVYDVTFILKNASST
jgi:hypothetical protein